ncbi:hypothetical protein GALL_06000 [mine drainage metagenome]|uniref:Uncharacterized protein n=1 Tax=mine drainage metagenome TaxID=410659 RepID=A0A1J5TTH0_9ZZZZ
MSVILFIGKSRGNFSVFFQILKEAGKSMPAATAAVATTAHGKIAAADICRDNARMGIPSQHKLQTSPPIIPVILKEQIHNDRTIAHRQER